MWITFFYFGIVGFRISYMAAAFAHVIDAIPSRALVDYGVGCPDLITEIISRALLSSALSTAAKP